MNKLKLTLLTSLIATLAACGDSVDNNNEASSIADTASSEMEASTADTTEMMDHAEETVDDAKAKAGEMADDAKEMATEAMEEVKEEGAAAMDAAKEKAAEMDITPPM
jgi:hypothetical protein